MNDRENAIIRTIETKVALAENREQKEIWVTIDVMREILDLLKEQETVMPEWRNGKAFCGKCGQPFPRHRGSLRRYCSYCGQAVKWE